MAQRKRREIESALASKGFENKGTDHEKYIFFVSGKKTSIWTKVSRGSKYKTISGVLLGEMAKQVKLSLEEFLNLVDCPLDYEAYVKLQIRKGNIRM